MMFAGIVVYLGYAVTCTASCGLSPYNPRIQNMQTTVKAGDLFDRGAHAADIDMKATANT